MEADNLALLEEKIQRTIDTVTRLRGERARAMDAAGELPALKAEISKLTAELEAVRAERDALKADKDAVRQRVQKLLEHIDTLNAG